METHPNLMASGVEVRLPEDPALAEITDNGQEHFLEVVQRHPTSSLCWALLAETCLRDEDLGSSIAAYAYARTGYHRGLDQLRRNGWKGSGHIPWEHEPNRGFLRSVHALAQAAARIEENEEAKRCAQFLRDSSETAHQVLAGDGTHHDGDAADTQAVEDTVEVFAGTDVNDHSGGPIPQQ